MTEIFSRVTWALAWLCHQRPERSPHLWGAQLPLCWRCTGILVGLICFTLLLVVRRRLPAPRISFALAALLPLDVLLASADVWSGANPVRFMTGVLWGVCATSLVLHLAMRLAAMTSATTNPATRHADPPARVALG